MSNQNTRNKKYIGNKMIEAAPMTKFEYNKLKDKNIPGDDQDGYLVGYYESMNKTDKVNYWSWSPKKQFEESYKEINGLNFGIAIELMKDGFKVKLPHWKDDVFLSIQKRDDHSKMTHDYIYVTSRFGLVPWVATQVEMLSNDWVLVE